MKDDGDKYENFSGRMLRLNTLRRLCSADWTTVMRY